MHPSSAVAVCRASESSLIRALLDPAAYDHPVDAVELVETHISWLLLTGRYAYKIKKPVSLSFVDFTTLERRKRFCDEELRLNSRLAQSLYVAVVPIGGTAEQPLVNRKPAIEHAVKMLQFAPSARVDRALEHGTVGRDDVCAFAETIAAFHAGLAPATLDTHFGSPALIVRTVLANLREIERLASNGELDALSSVRDWTEQACIRLEATFDVRRHGGAVRECHGDLHLENLVRLEGKIVAFDALEFDPDLRWVDVMSEVAFLVMDLLAHRRADLACAFLSRYLEISGDYAGLEVMLFYLVYRALVRAKVAALRAPIGETPRGERIGYCKLAARLIAPPGAPLLVLTHGFSGSGKTVLAGELLTRLPAIRIRSDVERKRQHGFAATADTSSGVASGVYTADASRATYAALERHAAGAVGAGFNVIVDAACLTRDQRAAFAKVARDRHARFVILDCECPPSVLRERIQARRAAGSDASEATEEVLDHQLAIAEPLTVDEVARTVRVDTGGAVDIADVLCRLADVEV